ncbi:DEAD/DEAH box helicase [Uliginosibacterium sediminicola]|uniref:ATP-dependent RNA helicase RhlE n=1 Tax=Uliginosibacterium sediminicola TaxID=2024550 RepID=A0ABU9YXN5_9RHOO
MSFASLGLSEPIVRAVSERGYTIPTPIQAQAIPAVLSGGDLLAGAQTGTGKTAGFTLPILQRLSTTSASRPGAIRALVLTPTRELAAQVEESVREYGKYLDLKSIVIFGGVSINPQISALRRGVDILVATPGRLLDHVQQKTVDLSQVEILILDEADRMLDMGFIRDIKKVLALLPKKRQNLLFSATFSDEIKTLADGLLNKPSMIEVARRNTTTELVEQKVMLVEQKAKRHVLAHLIKEQQWFQVLVFTRTKHGANRLAEQLTKGGIPSLAIHGNKSQNARTRALAEFKSGDLQVLVATDIAARGLDISELPHVVNFELPNVPEDYVHRIGRTGRAGSSGEALSLVDREESKYLSDIEKLIKRQLPRIAVPVFDMPVVADDSDARPPRAPQGRGRQGQGRGEGRSAQPRSAPRAAEGQRGASRSAEARAAQPRRADGNAPQAARREGAADGNRAPRSANAGAARKPGEGQRSKPRSDAPAPAPRRNADGTLVRQNDSRRTDRSAAPAADARKREGDKGGLSGNGGNPLREVFARGLNALRKLA